MDKENSIEFKVWGRFALFTDPVTKASGEKFSYPVPTYQALKGIVESVYWKPTLSWYIDKVRIMNAIRTESRSILIPKIINGTPDLAYYTYLVNPVYHVKAHFEWNENRPELACDRNENKHFYIAKRMLERGGRRDIFLGTRECQGYVEPCRFDEGKGYYDNETLSFGIMLHGIDYPDETGENKLKARLWSPVMKNGVIEFIRPEECDISREIKDYSAKKFTIGENLSGVDELYDEIKREEG